MKYDRSLLALIIGCFFFPFLFIFMIYLMALSQQNKLTWEGFQTTHWAGPYFAIGALLCVITFAVSLYWLKKDNECQLQEVIETQAVIDTPQSNRIIYSVTINHDQWEKFQRLGGAQWLDRVIDES